MNRIIDANDFTMSSRPTLRAAKRGRLNGLLGTTDTPLLTQEG